MIKVGLTGSIAVGKSYVLSILGELGCRVLDADATAREVVAPGTIGFERVINAFGTEILSGGDIDRKALGRIVFVSSEKRALLNSIVHPLVFEAQDNWIRSVAEDDPNAIAVIDAALMIESGGYKRFDKIVVVWCSPEIQLQRLMERDGLSEADARQRIAAQMPQEEKKLYSDFLIDTSAGREETRLQAVKLFAELKHLSIRY